MLILCRQNELRGIFIFISDLTINFAEHDAALEVLADEKSNHALTIKLDHSRGADQNLSPNALKCKLYMTASVFDLRTPFAEKTGSEARQTPKAIQQGGFSKFIRRSATHLDRDPRNSQLKSRWRAGAYQDAAMRAHLAESVGGRAVKIISIT